MKTILGARYTICSRCGDATTRHGLCSNCANPPKAIDPCARVVPRPNATWPPDTATMLADNPDTRPDVLPLLTEYFHLTRELRANPDKWAPTDENLAEMHKVDALADRIAPLLARPQTG